ncbi:MAG: hypothetical protein F6K30_00235 [Cyanothece sp. SIO2G6]|nr:hypothetical protein [Cyanothece sp. SIO2G6]
MTNHTMADHVLWLGQIQAQHRPLVGENAYHLGIALQKEYPVLPGLVIPAVFFEEFLESVDWVDPLLADLPHSSLHIDVDNPHQLQAIAQRIQQSVYAHPIASEHQATLFNAVQSINMPLVQIRPLLVLHPSLSSPSGPSPQSFPNSGSIDLPHHLLTSCICRNDNTELMAAIRQVWTSFFQANHLFYWQRLGIPLRYIQLALLIQPAVSSIAAGVAYVTQDFVDISASWGLVQGLQMGDIAPDRYRTYEDSQVPHQTIGSKRYAYALHQPTTPAQSVPPQPSTPTSRSNPTPMLGIAESPHHFLRRHIMSDQDAQQVVLSDELLLHIRQLSQNMRKLVGTPLCLEWSLHISPVTPLPTNSTLPWCNATHQRLWLHQELVQYLEQKNFVIQVTHLLPLGQRSHLLPKFDARSAPASSSNPPGQDPNVLTPPALVTPVSAIPTTEGKMTDPNPVVTGRAATSALSSSSILQGLGASRGSITAPVWVMQDVNQPINPAQIKDYILVAQNITFSCIHAVRVAKGIVSDQGGMTSHGAILAREVGIPAVVGVADAVAHFKTGDWIILDGDRGTITPISSPPDSMAMAAPPSTRDVQKPEPIVPATQVMLSLSQTDRLDALAQLPVNGVGLIRSELMIAQTLQQRSLKQWLQPDQRHKFSQTLAALIQQFAQAFAPRPIWYRTMDLRSHEYAQPTSMLSRPEPNPLLGYHGSMSYQLDSTLFLTELNALKQVQNNGFENVNILLPFVRTVEEFRFCHEAIQQSGWLDHTNGQVWIMAEVPSVLFLLPDYVAAGVQGIAIGSNDLNHLILAIDRTTANPMVGPTHPAVLKAVQTLVSAARKANIPCTLCGDLASQHPELIESFVRWGVTALSVEPNAVAQVQSKIQQAEWQLFQEWKRDRFSQS